MAGCMESGSSREQGEGVVHTHTDTITHKHKLIGTLQWLWGEGRCMKNINPQCTAEFWQIPAPGLLNLWAITPAGPGSSWCIMFHVIRH